MGHIANAFCHQRPALTMITLEALGKNPDEYIEFSIIPEVNFPLDTLQNYPYTHTAGSTGMEDLQYLYQG